MKTNNPILNKVIELSEIYLYQYDDMKFPQEYRKSDFMDSYQRLLHELNPSEANGTWLSFLEEMALYHMEYVMYLMIEDPKEKEKMVQHFSLSNAYAGLLIDIHKQTEKCLHPTVSIWVKTGGLFLANHIIGNDWECAEETLDAYIASINGNSSIIGYGHPEHQEAWFVLDVSAKVFNKTYDNTRAYLPEEYELFEEVLKVWDSEDIKTILILVEKLCERHLLVNRLALQDRYDKEEDGEGVMHVNVHNFIFPYEILAWLKLRERAGIKNPKTFSHPLMNTPIVKMLLKLKEPLPKPQELPFARELLEKLKEKCPEVEIPEWIEEINTQKEEDSQTISTQATENTEEEIEIYGEIIKSNQIVQKSGTYQAFLPKNHPLAEKVHQMPQSQRLGVQGVSMLPLGLSPEDEEQLRWEWIGE